MSSGVGIIFALLCVLSGGVWFSFRLARRAEAHVRIVDATGRNGLLRMGVRLRRAYHRFIGAVTACCWSSLVLIMARAVVPDWAPMHVTRPVIVGALVLALVLLAYASYDAEQRSLEMLQLAELEEQEAERRKREIEKLNGA